MSDKAACAIYLAGALVNFGLFIAWPDTAVAPLNWITCIVLMFMGLNSMSKI